MTCIPEQGLIATPIARPLYLLWWSVRSTTVDVKTLLSERK